ncbi:ADP-ribosylation factor GTPase-activating protein AGD7-like [Iris pallida]|uniref:ADP-ribosylation factor GTPase-activating protein AGD7-like n=1 Tax=Iris pallida TaxID=29817 RepID=A0AAX6ECE7_IRIPA|nr:ADP-ribosylation factor GTPase-activating protein AGD7-like [Iris pallida]
MRDLASGTVCIFQTYYLRRFSYQLHAGSTAPYEHLCNTMKRHIFLHTLSQGGGKTGAQPVFHHQGQCQHPELGLDVINLVFNGAMCFILYFNIYLDEIYKFTA